VDRGHPFSGSTKGGVYEKRGAQKGPDPRVNKGGEGNTTPNSPQRYSMPGLRERGKGERTIRLEKKGGGGKCQKFIEEAKI